MGDLLPIYSQSVAAIKKGERLKTDQWQSLRTGGGMAIVHQKTSEAI